MSEQSLRFWTVKAIVLRAHSRVGWSLKVRTPTVLKVIIWDIWAIWNQYVFLDQKRQCRSCVTAIGQVSQCCRCQEQFCQCSVIGMAVGISLGCSLCTPWSSWSSWFWGVDGFHRLPFGDSGSWCSVSLATGNWFIGRDLAWWLEGSWQAERERERKKEIKEGRENELEE